MQLYLDQGEPLDQFREELADPKVTGFQHRPHMQLAPDLPLQRQRFPTQIGSRFQHPLGKRQQMGPGMGEAHPTGAPIKKFRAQGILKGLDLAAEGRLGDVQLLGRPRQVT